MRTITFYSYKGGVGRSLTLANMAARLAEFGKKVCMIDFDLEAPGLHLKFQNEIKQPITKGLVEYIHSFATDGILPDKIEPFSVPMTLHNNKNVYLIPAGNIDDSNYWRSLSSIDWYQLVYENEHSISFFLDLKQKIKKELMPDFLLIDSRTGISEMSGITISLLADEVVIVSANNRENLLGSKRILDFLTNNKNPISEDKLPVSFVLSRIPSPVSPISRGKEQRLLAQIQEELSGVDKDHFFVLHSDRDLELKEERKIGNDIDDSRPSIKSAQITREYLLLFEHLTENVLTDEEKIKFKNIKTSEKLLKEALLTNNSDKKIELLRKVIDLNPQSVPAQLELAEANIGIGNLDDGLKIFKGVLESDPNQPIDTYNYLGGLYIAHNKYNEAEIIFNKILKLFPKQMEIGYYGMGSIMYRTEHFEKALAYINLALNEKVDEIALNARAATFRQLGDYESALSDIFNALELNPEYETAYITLAEIYLMQGKMSEFYLNLEIGMSKDPSAIAEQLPLEKVYKRVLNEPRFKNLLDKYEVQLPVYES